MSATNIDVIDVYSSSSASLGEENAPPRRRSERKRRLTDKAKEMIRQRQAKAEKASKKTRAKVEKASKKTKAKAASKKTEAKGEAAAEDEDVCPICLDPPVLPVRLECAHEFCFTCAKGLAGENHEDGPGRCSICRAPIPPGFFRRPELLQRTRADLVSAGDNNNWQWFYQGC